MNKPYITDAEMAALLRLDLSSFIEQSFKELYPTTEYLHNWHIDLIASKLTDVLEGRTTRLIINVPPRSLKSIITSVAFVAWALGKIPHSEIICASYGQDLSDKLAQDCRRVMQSVWYQRVFGVHLSGNRPPLTDFRTNAGGGRFATSVGGVLTGRGGDIIIIDDPIKPESAFSDTTRKTANEWFDHTVRSRLNDKKSGAIIIIMQRLHLDDLVGHVLEQGEWEVVSLPAIAEENQEFKIHSALDQRIITRNIGDVLHEQRESREVLDDLRASLGEYHFAAQYQQSPVALEGNFIKAKWLTYLELEAFPQSFSRIIQSWDTAFKIHELADFSVCTTWGEKANKYYLLNVWRQRVEYPQLKRTAIDLYNQYKPHKILVEDKSSGSALIAELRHEGIFCFEAINPKDDKKMRLHNRSALFENGAVILPKNAPWLGEYVAELISFPACRHDDQVDSTTQALDNLITGYAQSGLYDYLRMEYEAKHGKTEVV